MPSKKKKKKLAVSRGLRRAAADVADDILIGTKVEFFFTTENGTTASAVGRVCDIKPSGLCCVQFAEFGCNKIPKSKLVRTTKAAPECTAECANC